MLKLPHHVFQKIWKHLKHNWLFKSYFEERGYWEKEQFENELDSKIIELNDKIKLLDEKINELKSFEKEIN